MVLRPDVNLTATDDKSDRFSLLVSSKIFLASCFAVGLITFMQDREIDGLNEQLAEDSRCLEHLQMQLLQERSKRTDVERENSMLHEQISMLMNMLEETEPPVDVEVASEDS